MKRIIMIGLVLALLATMILSTAAFACGPCGTCDGSQARTGAGAQNGSGPQAAGGYGPGDGTGGAGGGVYGPGPYGYCHDANGDGVCGS